MRLNYTFQIIADFLNYAYAILSFLRNSMGHKQQDISRALQRKCNKNLGEQRNKKQTNNTPSDIPRMKSNNTSQAEKTYKKSLSLNNMHAIHQKKVFQ